MSDCPYLEPCPIFTMFSLDASRRFWIELYCQGPLQQECARKNLKESGQPVPRTLLPSGDRLESLEE